MLDGYGADSFAAIVGIPLSTWGSIYLQIRLTTVHILHCYLVE